MKIDVAEAEAERFAAYICKAVRRRSNRSRPPARCGADAKPSATSTCLLTMKPGHDKQEDIDAVAEHILQLPAHRANARARREQSERAARKPHASGSCGCLKKENFGAALLYFTGSKEHNVVAARPRERYGLDAERIRPDHT